MKGRTTFAIAHRLSTVRSFDCIMGLEQGRIIKRGIHDQLIEEKGGTTRFTRATPSERKLFSFC